MTTTPNYEIREVPVTKMEKQKVCTGVTHQLLPATDRSGDRVSPFPKYEDPKMIAQIAYGLINCLEWAAQTEGREFWADVHDRLSAVAKRMAEKKEISGLSGTAQVKKQQQPTIVVVNSDGKILPSGHTNKKFNPDGSRRGPIASTAYVADTAYVGPEAEVAHQAKVLDGARLRGQAFVGSEAVVSGLAVLDNTARVFGRAHVGGGAQVIGSAWVTERARVSEYAIIAGNCWVKGDAKVSGGAVITENAIVTEHSIISGDARISGNARIQGAHFGGLSLVTSGVHA